MKSCISTAGIKRLSIVNSGAACVTSKVSRRVSSHTVLPLVLLCAIFLPFSFLRLSYLLLQSSAVCSSSSTLGCLGWGILSGNDATLRLSAELSQSFVEAKEGGSSTNSHEDATLSSFDQLVKEVTSKQQDIKAFAFKTKALFLMMEQEVLLARQHESIYWHIASYGIPKSLHCLCLKLADEYTINHMARSLLPPAEHFFRLGDPSLHHVVLLTDNVLATSVVISSTVQNSANPEKLVFHIVTDKKTYTPMHAWFTLNSIDLAVVEVKGLHHFEWSAEVNNEIKETQESHRLIWTHYYNSLKEHYQEDRKYWRLLDALNPSFISPINHLRIYIPEMFPELNKIVFLDDDIVVQRDIGSLWDLSLNGNVVGAVIDSGHGNDNCPGRKYKDHLNFSHPIISSKFDPDGCAWLDGMNIIDLEVWRTTNITETYRQWLKLNLNSGLDLWGPGDFPLSLMAFDGHVHQIDPSWHLSGLANRPPEEIPPEILESAAVLHFSGPAKPWLGIRHPKVERLWNKHVNFSNEFVKGCGITE